ncbi:MAG: hypothetical protein WC736_00710 [Gallionella sp.]
MSENSQSKLLRHGMDARLDTLLTVLILALLLGMSIDAALGL